MEGELEGLDWASRVRVIHFNDLIAHAHALGFDDDVEHWQAEKAAFIAARRSEGQER